MPNTQRSLLSVAYDAEEDFESLMETLTEKPVEMKWGKRDGETKLWITPRSELTKEEEERIKKFKARIIRRLQETKYRVTGELQNFDQVKDLAKEYFSQKREAG